MSKQSEQRQFADYDRITKSEAGKFLINNYGEFTPIEARISENLENILHLQSEIYHESENSAWGMMRELMVAFKNHFNPISPFFSETQLDIDFIVVEAIYADELKRLLEGFQYECQEERFKDKDIFIFVYKRPCDSFGENHKGFHSVFGARALGLGRSGIGFGYYTYTNMGGRYWVL
ncbi:MAG: hypothetical protein LBS21_13860 [Clostridiales bacterium]|nr:hypothetical protein [Clostridiales bacterium]